MILTSNSTLEELMVYGLPVSTTPSLVPNGVEDLSLSPRLLFPSSPPPLLPSSPRPLVVSFWPRHAAGVFNRRLMVGGHSVLLATLGIALQRLKPDSQESIKGFYKRIWDLFYLEYLMYPFI